MKRESLLVTLLLLAISPGVLAQTSVDEPQSDDAEQGDCGRRMWLAGAVLLPAGVLIDALTIPGALTAGTAGRRIPAEVGFMVGITSIIVGTVALAIGLTRRRRCRLDRQEALAPLFGCLMRRGFLPGNPQNPWSRLTNQRIRGKSSYD